MAPSAPCLIALLPADHDGGGVVACGAAVDQALVAAGQVAAHDAYGLELVHALRHRHQGAHGAERLTAEVSVGTCENHPNSTGRKLGCNPDNAVVEELRFVYRN